MSGDDQSRQPWEPDPRKLGNWTSLFEDGRTRKPESSPSPAPVTAEPEKDEDVIDELRDLEKADYKPWVLQRGPSRPAMLLHLRRFEPKSGFWLSWQISYPHLIAAEFVGDRMLSLDFGTRQFVIQGEGLSQMSRHLQAGAVLLLQEYSTDIWKSRPPGAMIGAIQKL